MVLTRPRCSLGGASGEYCPVTEEAAGPPTSAPDLARFAVTRWGPPDAHGSHEKGPWAPYRTRPIRQALALLPLLAIARCEARDSPASRTQGVAGGGGVGGDGPAPSGPGSLAVGTPIPLETVCSGSPPWGTNTTCPHRPHLWDVCDHRSLPPSGHAILSGSHPGTHGRGGGRRGPAGRTAPPPPRGPGGPAAALVSSGM